MVYRKIPFQKSRGSMALHGDEGLTPILPKRVPHGFGPQFPNSTMLGAVAPVGTTVIMRPQPNAPAGFPGFFAWLKATQPALYNYAKVALPAQVTQAEGHRTGGATLSGLGMTTRPPTKRRPRAGFFGENMDPTTGLRGLGDDSDIDSLATADLTDFSVGNSIINTPLPTVNIPDTNAETSSVGVPPSPSTSTVAQIVNTLTAAAPSVLNDINSQTLFNTQLARAQAGLPPLNTAAYGIGTTLSSLGSAAPILLLGGGLVLFLMLSKK
jgi:hypothetical protein